MTPLTSEEQQRCRIWKRLREGFITFVPRDGSLEMNEFDSIISSCRIHWTMITFGAHVDKLDEVERIVQTVDRRNVRDELNKLRPLEGMRILEIGGFQSRYLVCPETIACEHPCLSDKVREYMAKDYPDKQSIFVRDDKELAKRFRELDPDRKYYGPNMALLVNDAVQSPQPNVGGDVRFITSMKESQEGQSLFWDDKARLWRFYDEFPEDERFKSKFAENSQSLEQLGFDKRFDLIVSQLICENLENMRYFGRNYLKKGGFEAHMLLQIDRPDGFTESYEQMGMSHLINEKEFSNLMVFRRVRE